MRKVLYILGQFNDSDVEWLARCGTRRSVTDGEIIVHEGCSISDYANVYSHEHDLNDGMIVQNTRTEIGPKARITYHATVMSGVRVHEHGLLGSMGVATKDVPPYTIAVGIPAKGVKVKTIAPAAVGSAGESK